MLTLPGTLQAQDSNFQLTYHVERTASAALDVEACGEIATTIAAQAGLRTNVQSYLGQLVVVSGGAEDQGSYIVQCIEVDETTVSVVQGIDYQPQKAVMGEFADDAAAALMDAVR